jgi:hypothetical protein
MDAKPVQWIVDMLATPQRLCRPSSVSATYCEPWSLQVRLAFLSKSN